MFIVSKRKYEEMKDDYEKYINRLNNKITCF